ncbi:prolyl oligopeptidase family serine peptidase [Actinoplanes sp. CA-015351]|uniref:prolyl oligopeptidase family serine peptidase n=1 Tax=Actinoplanes sp. CA-015351 TaxID=3239897 RepID=UPI003D974492
MQRRNLLKGVAGAGVLMVSGVAACSSDSGGGSAARKATAITQVFGDGQKFVAVAVEFDKEIATSALTASAFTVAGRTVTKVYANTSAAVAGQGADGKYVIVELSPDDDGAALWGDSQGGGGQNGGAQNGGGPDGGAMPSGGPGGGGAMPSGGPGGGGVMPSGAAGQQGGGPPQGGAAPVIKEASGSVTQAGAVQAVDGTTYAADSTALATSAVLSPVVDDFQQLSYADPATGQTLQYNLFVPKDYDDTKSYPLVLFMHDASVVGATVKGPLVQGLGAVCWASDADQAKNPAFVLAPQYATVVVEDDYQPTKDFEATVNLVNALAGQYSIDTKRLYATGQSMGAMMTIGMNAQHADLFAASFIVAGQWPAEQTTALAGKKLWITVSEGDTKAFPGMTAITALAAKNGAKVTHATWQGDAGADEFATDVSTMEGKGAGINFASFATGTIPAVTSGATMEHMATWQVAYAIPGIREWIMKQSA